MGSKYPRTFARRTAIGRISMLLCKRCRESWIITFWLDSKLFPIGDFEHLFECTKPTRKSNEPARTSCHLYVSFMHRVHDHLDHSQREHRDRIFAYSRPYQFHLGIDSVRRRSGKKERRTISLPASSNSTKRVEPSPVTFSSSPHLERISRGITPTTSPPASSTAPDTIPMIPLDPPP